MQDNYTTLNRTRSSRLSVLETNKVLRNTYMLLSATLIFSSLTAWFAVTANVPPMNPILTIVLYVGLIFLVQATRNSAMGILSVFALTGFLGFTAAPLINLALTLQNGSQLITAAFGLTGTVFLVLSGYVINTKTDFSYMRGFLIAALTTIFIGSLISMFIAAPMMHLILSFGMVLVASGLILYHTSEIIHGGETNYITATVMLYVQLWTLFMNLLQIFMALSGRND